MDFAERAARNEEIFREVNRGIDVGAERHHVESPLPFHCECAQAFCVETVAVSPTDYERVAKERYRFIVIAGHEDPEVEQVVEEHGAFNVVEKVGEARVQIDRDHPQERHQN
jgi:hypothetical protein